MERLSGFEFEDASGMQAAGIDTNALLRAGLISFLEGALVHGVFHGDLHGGNLFVLPDGRTALLDFGITGRLDERKRLAFLRLLVLGSSGDVRGQLAALRDLGAFPPDTDLDAVIADLGLDQPIKDPTTMSADELVGEFRDLTKKLLEYGARAPKELMLFVKNMMFLDGATATLAPDLDIIGEIAHVYLYFQEHYGDRIAQDLGLEAPPELDLVSVKAGLGVGPEWGDSLTYAEVRERRELIRTRMQAQQQRKRRRGRSCLGRSRRARLFYAHPMPELPEMQALAERLEEFLEGAAFTGVDPLGFSALKTVLPGPEALVGRRLDAVRRRGKYLRFVTDGDVAIVLHLSQAGRLDTETPAKRTKPKGAAVRFRFDDDRAVLVREHGHERKVAWWVLAGDDPGPTAGLGPEPDSPEFETLLRTSADKRRIHTMLRDQRTVAGIGRGYADDALQRAHISPYATLAKLTPEERGGCSTRSAAR